MDEEDFENSLDELKNDISDLENRVSNLENQKRSGMAGSDGCLIFAWLLGLTIFLFYKF